MRGESGGSTDDTTDEGVRGDGEGGQHTRSAKGICATAAATTHWYCRSGSAFKKDVTLGAGVVEDMVRECEGAGGWAVRVCVGVCVCVCVCLCV